MGVRGEHVLQVMMWFALVNRGTMIVVVVHVMGMGGRGSGRRRGGWSRRRTSSLGFTRKPAQNRVGKYHYET